MRANRLSFWAVLVAAVCLAAVPMACRSPFKRNPSSQVQPLDDRNIRYGMPAPATKDVDNYTAYLIDRPEYSLSYNDKMKHANWVSWALEQKDIGTVPRSSFTVDPLLPTEFKRVSSSMYDNSGFDRGHLCNSKDRTATIEINDATFVMTNAIPQSPNNNQRGWESFESYCRTVASEGKELLIVAGPHGTGGEGTRGRKDFIAAKDFRINVPHSTWKVVLVLSAPNSPVDSSSTMFGIWMPNDQSVGQGWQPYVVTVAEVEKRTGFTFFPRLPESVVGTLKKQKSSELIAAR